MDVQTKKFALEHMINIFKVMLVARYFIRKKNVNFNCKDLCYNPTNM